MVGTAHLRADDPETGEPPGYALLRANPEFLSAVERELEPRLLAECEAIESRLREPLEAARPKWTDGRTLP